ncbi:WD repeat-containing protein 13 [Schistosoma haematobium]|uniref:WD repeat-containing protein 13 n=1 Tax=Schistosoma haematobium TaxID=6185 RepID=A0A095B2F8_SCHHA|nr:WD repeat-containing protein 13 [Schistosoma haematobium]KAH9590663.1 WD repeat-containing protein 13 [Schistosoma haematobium]CAH8660270.1 unnamed protein product [Schistosoma haematobium]CAH8666263.1 unnamed protein product [Schistosoma haematobium]
MSCDVWQQVLALDSRYSAVRPITKSSTELRQLYLRRRNQLTREKAALSVNEAFRHPNLSCSFQYAAGTSVASFVAYRNIREQLLLSLYGPAKPHRCASPQLSLTKTRSYDESTKLPSLLNYSMTKSICDTSSDYLTPGRTETLGESYAFSGIEHIFDHHSGAVNRLSFANHDSSRLALASSDGTVSICRISPASGVFSIACVLPEYRVKQTEITDIAWSMTNEFLASTSLDGNICLWDVGEAKLAREYLSTELKLGPLLTCAFQPANNNIFAVGSVTGIIQMVNLSTGKNCVRGMDRIHVAARGSKTRLNSSVTELRGLLGTGCITTLAFEDATGNYLWVGTDRGIIQSYLCEPSTGFIIRSQRVDISSLNLSVVPTCPENGIKLNNLLYERPPSTRKTYFLSKADQSFKRWSSLKSRARTHNAIDKLRSNEGTSLAPSITSLSIYSWLSKEKSETYLLINAAGIGLLLLRLTLDNRNVILEQRFPVHHRSFNSVPKALRLIHSCFAPLISFRSGACAASGSEDCNVYLYNVLRSRNADPATGNSSSHNKQTSTGVVTILQGHTAPVLDVAISWDENMLASADEKGSVIIWRRQEKSDTS